MNWNGLLKLNQEPTRKVTNEYVVFPPKPTPYKDASSRSFQGYSRIGHPHQTQGNKYPTSGCQMNQFHPLNNGSLSFKYYQYVYHKIYLAVV